MDARQVSSSLQRGGCLLLVSLLIFKKLQILGSCLLIGTKNFRTRQSLEILSNTASISPLVEAPGLYLNTWKQQSGKVFPFPTTEDTE